MSKTPYKVEIIVEVENDEGICHDRVKKAVEYAIKNAVVDAFHNGYEHPEAHNITISPVSVEVK